MPYIDSRAVAHMAAVVGGFDVAVPFIDGYFHPLHAIYHRRCLPAVERLISDKCFTLHRLIDNLRAKHWLVNDNLLLRNVNEPSDLTNTETR